MRKGFTLIELSIVLVIIGLIVGGVLTGRHLIELATTRQIISKTEQFKIAINSFRNKYNGLPGDITNATTFWPADTSNNCLGLSLDTTPRMETCNGTGNGLVDDGGYEGFRAIQQLANAGLIKGTYTGQSMILSSNRPSPGVNIPSLDHRGGGLFFSTSSLIYSDDAFTDNGENRIYIGAGHASPSNFHHNHYPFLSGAMAHQIDSKMDDGLPGTGKIQAVGPGGGIITNCSGTTDPLTARYQVVPPASGESSVCALIDMGV